MSQNHQTVQLSAGRHSGPDHGACVMELASMLAGEPFSDRPRSVSRTLAAVLRGYNDGLDDQRRQQLKRFAAASVGTAGGRSLERRRRRLVRQALVELGAPGRPPAGLVWLFDAGDLAAVARRYARHVSLEADEDLHARVLMLADALVAMSGPVPVAPEPSREKALL